MAPSNCLPQPRQYCEPVLPCPAGFRSPQYSARSSSTPAQGGVTMGPHRRPPGVRLAGRTPDRALCLRVEVRTCWARPRFESSQARHQPDGETHAAAWVQHPGSEHRRRDVAWVGAPSWCPRATRMFGGGNNRQRVTNWECCEVSQNRLCEVQLTIEELSLVVAAAASFFLLVRSC